VIWIYYAAFRFRKLRPLEKFRRSLIVRLLFRALAVESYSLRALIFAGRAWPRIRPHPEFRVNYSTPNSFANCFHFPSTSARVFPSITISSGHGRANPSVDHFRVASTPIFEP
jgi:hypothetical protein